MVSSYHFVEAMVFVLEILFAGGSCTPAEVDKRKTPAKIRNDMAKAIEIANRCVIKI